MEQAGLSTFTILNDIRERLAEVTDAQMAWAERKLKPLKREKVIGTVMPEALRKLFTLTQLLVVECVKSRALAEVEPDVIAETDYRERSAIFDIMSDLTLLLFFSQAKLELGFHNSAGVGLREGWVLVENAGAAGMPPILAALLGGTAGGSNDD